MSLRTLNTPTPTIERVDSVGTPGDVVGRSLTELTQREKRNLIDVNVQNNVIRKGVEFNHFNSRQNCKLYLYD